MQKRRWRAVVVLRKLLTCAICAITMMALLSVHVQVFPSSKVPDLPEPYKLPTTTTQQLDVNKYSRVSIEQEQSWSKEQTPSHLSKPPLPSHKLDGARGNSDSKLWKHPPYRDYWPCVEPSSNYTFPGESKGYLLVHTNGGLNQMRAGICDMVVVARIINATLVVPELDKRSFWQDTSNFSDVFDEDHFISALANDVKVIKKLPKEMVSAAKIVKQFRSWSGMDYYQGEITSLWEDYQVIRAAKSDSRLANNNLPPDIQKLRCRACYEALRFAPRIEEMGKILVERMRSYGPYIALHLRYEKDMLAFSGCTHGLSSAEADELKKIREETAYWKVKEIDSREQRSKGYCPLTPKEEKLASVEELKPFTNHASQMAALDYIVSIESDVFIPSYSGNMARAVEGHRRFLGHRKTISPDRKQLVHMFDKLNEENRKKVKIYQKRLLKCTKNGKDPQGREKAISGTKGMERFRSEEPFM
ncbi:hypothetical protein GH714_025911 [Hevea brasiliensis]|uniref:O-fucosyltransferase family protein n=1 Tax=Hevea brasiliensis TaxID=3981 RepID=A0A6A6KTU1_HEVBR|nr:hypothetical protein GH714_025911 [Hevea brasiliensis]